MVIVFCVSVIVPNDLKIVNSFRQTCVSKIIVFCITPIVPESFMIISSINQCPGVTVPKCRRFWRTLRWRSFSAKATNRVYQHVRMAGQVLATHKVVLLSHRTLSFSLQPALRNKTVPKPASTLNSIFPPELTPTPFLVPGLASS